MLIFLIILLWGYMILLKEKKYLMASNKIDSIKFNGPIYSLFPDSGFKEIIDYAHIRNISVTTGSILEQLYILSIGDSSLLNKIYLKKYKEIGDACSFGLKLVAKFGVSETNVGLPGIRILKKSNKILVASDGITRNLPNKGHEKQQWCANIMDEIMTSKNFKNAIFEAPDPETITLLLEHYGPDINLLVVHSHAYLKLVRYDDTKLQKPPLYLSYNIVKFMKQLKF
ncbi:hypothetical protein C1645_875523 [Glomus cerebriforme]|uniref:PPM-type phosphatase domain-containing protein n=1 Tax=Glomus cerebriforme TaxID=658196 RepID=A0A397SZE7_9GLOM|nr:hypothetical protein C1645_875523 [Glomus cerebriforme]